MKALRLARALLVAACSVAALTSCSSSSSATPPPAASSSPDVIAWCTQAVACMAVDPSGVAYTQATCLSENDGWIPPPMCVAQYTAAACGDITSASPVGLALASLCWPQCTPAGTATCSGTQVTKCESDGVSTTGAQYTYDCNGFCASQSLTFTGVCAATNGSKTSPSGQAMCWCQ